MNEPETPKPEATNDTQVDTAERLVLAAFAVAVFFVVFHILLPGSVDWGPLIPSIYAGMVTMLLFKFHDQRRRGEISLAEQRKKSIKTIGAFMLSAAVLLTPVFIWPEHAFRIVVAIGLLIFVVGSIQSLVQWRKKRAAAKQVVPADSQEDSR